MCNRGSSDKCRNSVTRKSLLQLISQMGIDIPMDQIQDIQINPNSILVTYFKKDHAGDLIFCSNHSDSEHLVTGSKLFKIVG